MPNSIRYCRSWVARIDKHQLYSQAGKRCSSWWASGDTCEAWGQTLLKQLDRETRISRISKDLSLFDSNLPFESVQHKLSKVLNQSSVGIRLALKLREDSLSVLSSSTEKKGSWADLDGFLKSWLSSAFCNEALTLQRIKFDTSSGDVLEKIARGEVSNDLIICNDHALTNDL